MTQRQLYMLTEGIFFHAYRCFENLVHDVFILHCLERPDVSGMKARSYLRPKSFLHTEELMQSSLRFLEWSDPNALIKRSELYLKNGDPIKIVLTANRVLLDDLRKLRNHIAHNSTQSRKGYVDVLQRKLGTIPLRLPRVGEFLLTSDTVAPHKYQLVTYIEEVERVGEALAGR